MILDIRYIDAAPEQIQGVRLTSIYHRYEMNSAPELVIHFADQTKPQRNIPLARILHTTISND